MGARWASEGRTGLTPWVRARVAGPDRIAVPMALVLGVSVVGAHIVARLNQRMLVEGVVALPESSRMRAAALSL